MIYTLLFVLAGLVVSASALSVCVILWDSHKPIDIMSENDMVVETVNSIRPLEYYTMTKEEIAKAAKNAGVKVNKFDTKDEMISKIMEANVNA